MAVMIDMAALPKIDGDVHTLETAYIRQVGKELGFSEDEIGEILDICI